MFKFVSRYLDWKWKGVCNKWEYKIYLLFLSPLAYVNVNKSNLLWCIVLCAWNRSMYVNCTRPELWTKSPKLLRISAIWWDQQDRCHRQTPKQYCNTFISSIIMLPFDVFLLSSLDTAMHYNAFFHFFVRSDLKIISLKRKWFLVFDSVGNKKATRSDKKLTKASLCHVGERAKICEKSR